MNRVLISICFVLIGIITDAHGQFYPDSWTLGPNWAYSRAMNDIDLARIATQGSINNSLIEENRTRQERIKPKIATGISSFRADQSYILPREISNNVKGTAQEKKVVETALEQAIKAFQLRALKQGYPANDLAFAMTYFFYNNFAIYQGIRPMWVNSNGEMQYNVSRWPIYAGQVKAVYQQFSKLLANQKAIEKISDREKQRIAEYLAISTTIFYELYAEVEPKLSNDMKQVAEIRETARKNIEGLMGTAIDKIKLGDQGILVAK